MAQTKMYQRNLAKVDREKRYLLADAVKVLADFEGKKFDETVNVAVRLGVDPKQTDQSIRGAVVLPHGLGKSVRVLVFAKGEKAEEAKKAGADHIGAEELVEKINGGWLDFDSIVATPDLMGQVGRLGKVLGPRGLMPNPKLGTVTQDVSKAVRELKAGKVEYRLDKAGIVHAPVGKKSFGPAKIEENLKVLLETLVRAKPPSSKGVFLRSITIACTMSPGVKVDPSPFLA